MSATTSRSRRVTWREPSILPGFAPSLTFTLLWLGIIVVGPLAVMLWFTAGLGWRGFLHIVLRPRVLADLRVTVGSALIASLANLLCGLLIAWVLSRYRFPLRRIADALVDLPFALPTAVAGITLTALYSPNGWIGKILDPNGMAILKASGLQWIGLISEKDRSIAFTPLGICIALTFIGLPFVVRTVQPVLQDLDQEVEEAAISLGASRAQTFRFVILPTLTPALLTGFALAFARALGEYGSVVFIAGNMPMKTEVVPLLIITRLEQYDYVGATAIAATMLLVSFLMLLIVNIVQWWST
ncbi:MAG TPA: sulfate ABC transporter permease subunit CysT, partial [Acidocella sp.]|uniref:ABC transporter permease n=1 Tax=Acidocella sp. TaxID=50710 RepID=UPI002BEE0E37